MVTDNEWCSVSGIAPLSHYFLYFHRNDDDALFVPNDNFFFHPFYALALLFQTHFLFVGFFLSASSKEDKLIITLLLFLPGQAALS